MSWLADAAALAAAHRSSRRTGDRWLASEPYRAMAATLEMAGATGDVEAIVAAARSLLAETAWVAALLAPLIEELAADPLFEPPIRLHRDPLRIGAVLHEGRHATLTATVMRADALAAVPLPRSVVVPGRIAVVRYHAADGAVLRGWSAGAVADPFIAGEAPPCRPLAAVTLCDGEVRVLDGRIEGYIVTTTPRDLVTLSCRVSAGAAPVSREYAIGTGALIRAGSLDQQAARISMLLTLLRRAGRSDAAACFDSATRDSAFDLRWTAMREWLALDAAAALPRLRAMAHDDPHHEVRTAAAATLPQAEALLCHG